MRCYYSSAVSICDFSCSCRSLMSTSSGFATLIRFLITEVTKFVWACLRLLDYKQKVERLGQHDISNDDASLASDNTGACAQKRTTIRYCIEQPWYQCSAYDWSGIGRNNCILCRNRCRVCFECAHVFSSQFHFVSLAARGTD